MQPESTPIRGCISDRVELMRESTRQVSRRRSFTLVELLVVVSIIGILLSLLLPSFRQFREHARTVACQSHMGSIGKGVLNYALDLDTFPITTEGNTRPISWRYGGWTGSNAHLWKMHRGGAYYVPTDERPLSVYMNPKSPLTATSRLAAFRCPSDALSHRAGVIGLQGEALPAYEDIGTSYHLNWQWFEDQTRLPDPRSPNRNVDRVTRGERIWWKYMQRNAAEFVTLLEDPADYALAKRTQVDGNHKKFSKHNFAFLDGPVEYLHADTRYRHQPGWTVVDKTPPYKEWWLD